MNYWINPNTREKRDCLKDSSGDYVSEGNGIYTLYLISRYDESITDCGFSIGAYMINSD